MTRSLSFALASAGLILFTACGPSAKPASSVQDETPAARRATPADVWAILGHSNCGGCHLTGEARTGMGHFTNQDEREFYKSLAYHTLAMQEDVVRVEGADALKHVPWLAKPLINPREEGNAERFITRIQRDGEIFGAEDRRVLSQWIAQGAPLPEPEFQEAFGEVRAIIARQRGTP